jgi:hypothetical protein
MKISLPKSFISAVSLFTALVCGPAVLHAQAPAGPISGGPPQPSDVPSARPQPPTVEVKPRTSIFGSWKLNLDESDDPRQKTQQARGSSGGGNRSGGVRLGIPGMGGGPYGGRRGSGQNGENEQDRERMQALIAAPNAITLAQRDPKGPEVDLLDDQNRTTQFFTDGRKLEKSKDATHEQVAAHWDGNRLVTDEKNPRGGKMSRTYELSYDGMQLHETVEFTRGRSNSPISIRYIYDQKSAPSQTRDNGATSR